MILSRRPLNLVLVHQPSVLEIEDLRIIAAEVKKLAPDIHVSIAEPWMWAGKPSDAYWQRPTVTVSFGDTGRFAPIRGPIFMNQPIAKIDQYERLTAAGVATPKTAKYEIGMGLSEEDWGPLVILKPAPLHMTSSGRALYLFRTRSLERPRSRRLPARPCRPQGSDAGATLRRHRHQVQDLSLPHIVRRNHVPVRW